MPGFPHAPDVEMRIRDRRKVELPNDLRLISLTVRWPLPRMRKKVGSGQASLLVKIVEKRVGVDCAHGNRFTARAEAGSTAGTSRNSARKARPPVQLRPSPYRQYADPLATLCMYVQRCIEAEAAKSLVPFVRQDSQWFLHRGEEQLVVEPERFDADAPSELADKAGISHAVDNLRVADCRRH